MNNKPSVSVIIPSYNSSQTICQSLTALHKQKTQVNYEVIVVDSCGNGLAKSIQSTFPTVKVISSPERKFPGHARNEGIELAQGDILAFTDSDCLASPKWIENIAAAHRASTPVIGGAVKNANPASYVGWAYYLCEFSHWLPQPQPRQMLEIPTCCLSVKKWAFEAYGPFLENTYGSDSAFQWKLAQAGYNSLFDPSIQVEHINPSNLRNFIRHEIMHGRHFAVVRLSEKKFTPLKRLVYLGLWFLLPLLLFARTAVRVFSSKNYRIAFLLVAPIVFIGHLAWAWGEFLGYLTGSKE